MVSRISPFSLKSKRRKTNKQVSFGDDNIVVKQIERIPLEEQAAVWYSEKEMAMMQRIDSLPEGATPGEPSEEEMSHYYAEKHVKKITNKCCTQLEQADGHWDPKMAKELRKMSLAGSKDHRNAATKRAKSVYKEVYSQDATKSGSFLTMFMTTRGATSTKPKLERADTQLTQPMESIMMDPEDRPELMRSAGVMRMPLAA